jgi:DNA-binding transcriptional LysR family regulator
VRRLRRCCLTPALPKLATEHPEITRDVRLADAIVNVVDEQIDVVTRIGSCAAAA